MEKREDIKGVPTLTDKSLRVPKWRWFYTITAAYPLHKRNEFWPKYYKVVNLPTTPTTHPYLEHCATVTIEDVRAGFLTHTVFLVSPGEAVAAHGALRTVMMELFWDMEGFRYSLEGMWGLTEWP